MGGLDSDWSQRHPSQPGKQAIVVPYCTLAASLGIPVGLEHVCGIGSGLQYRISPFRDGGFITAGY